MTEIVVENIHEYLRSVGENIRAGHVKVEDYIIFKVCTVPGSDGDTCQIRLTLELFAALGKEPGGLSGCEESTPRTSRVEDEVQGRERPLRRCYTVYLLSGDRWRIVKDRPG
jgi:hypothetical protein